MKTIWHLFKSDMSHLFSNAIAGIIVLGLVFLPSIFSWYNILACANVFDNTGSLTVAVANTDEGYKSDLIPVKINVGESVQSALRENDQLNWVFVSEEEAVDGARSGKYYAAVVIPSTFSRDMMTFYSDNAEHAQIVYYTNEKKSAVAPKVTDQGADRVSYQVNQVFIQTMSEIALSLAQGVQNYADSNNLTSYLGNLTKSVDKSGDELLRAAHMLDSYSSLLGASRNLLQSSSNLIKQAQISVDEVSSTAQTGKQGIADVSDALKQATSQLDASLAQAKEAYAHVAQSIDDIKNASVGLTSETASALRSQAKQLETTIADERKILDILKKIGETDPQIAAYANLLESSIDKQESLVDSMNKAADSIEQGNSDAQQQFEEAKRLADSASASVANLSDDYTNNVLPELDSLAQSVAQAASDLDENAAELKSASSDMSGAADSAATTLGIAQFKLDRTSADLTKASQRMKDFSSQLTDAMNSSDIARIREVLGNDPTVLATALSAPVTLDREAVFPANDFGSQMAPLYTVLAMWIGSLLLVVAIKVGVAKPVRQELGYPRLSKLFLGRFGVFAVLSLMQTTCMGLGNWLFLGVQVTHPLLFMLCYWFAGLVFTFIMYSLVVSFANLGKAIGVLLLIVQVTSAGGSFPLQLLPRIFQIMSPYMPATHVINAMRAAMMGVYQNDYWMSMGALALFIIPAAVLGLALRKPFMKFMKFYIGKVENSKLVN